MEHLQEYAIQHKALGYTQSEAPCPILTNTSG
jgi:hypothetical protein